MEYVKSCGGMLGMSIAVDDEAPIYLTGTPPPSVLADLRQACEDASCAVVAHNGSFDFRAIRYLLDLPHPVRGRCSLDMAYAAWPNLAGALKADDGAGDKRDPKAYSLASLAITLGTGLRKLDKPDDDDATSMAAYCVRDVELCRLVYRKALARLSPGEIKINEMAQLINSMHLEVRLDKVNDAVAAFNAAASEQRTAAGKLLGDDVAALMFGQESDGSVRSVKTNATRKVLLEHLGFATPTISYKQLNPAKLAVAPEAAAVLKATSETNKVLSHRRRVGAFVGTPRVDVELHPFRAHTGRYSGPSTGRGLNCHNMPKHNKLLAKAVRSMFSLPDGWCWVRADLANVEYRGSGLLTRSPHVNTLFCNNPLADPYSAFWFEGTGQVVTKKDPARQVAKAAVLGLSYMMGTGTWIATLLKAMAQPDSGLSIADMTALADVQGWQMNRYVKAQSTKANSDPAVGRVASGSHAAFHKVHPEFGSFADWLVDSVTEACRSGHPQAALDAMLRDPRAPDPALVRLLWENAPDMENAVRVQIGGWDMPTVTWRDVGVRFVEGQGTGMCLSYRQAGSKGYHSLYRSICVENVVQSWATVALRRAKLALANLGFPACLSVHDEILIPTPCDRDSVLRARDALLTTLGPGNSLGYGWACIINPDEINVSKTLYEVELGRGWWSALEAGSDDGLKSLP